MSRAIVLLSGGMDSLVCAATAIKECEEVYFLHFSYGQRTESKELACFEALVSHYQPKGAKVVDYHWLKEIGGSALTDKTMEIGVSTPQITTENTESTESSETYNPTNHLTLGARNAPLHPSNHQAFNSPNPITRQHANTPERPYSSTPALQHSQIPNTYVPFRNATLLCAAVSWAEVLMADSIYIGAVEEDSSGYPDCREVFFKAFEQVILTGTKADHAIKVVTPVLHLSKPEIVKLGRQLQAPFQHSWSCYEDNEQACGVCDSCTLRLKAFANAGFTDPINYR